jgi:hypothetical protein
VGEEKDSWAELRLWAHVWQTLWLVEQVKSHHYVEPRLVSYIADALKHLGVFRCKIIWNSATVVLFVCI